MKFGIDRVNITPDYKTLLDGYGERNDICDGVNDPITFTSLILEENGQKCFIGSVDLVTIDPEHAIQLQKTIAQQLGIDTRYVILNCSHTHGSIRVRKPLFMEAKTKEIMFYINRNKTFFNRQVLKSVRKAVRNMKSCKLFYGEGKTSIPMNRRLYVNGKIQNKPNPKGKVDDTIKILKVVQSDESIGAIMVRLSCHPVATGAQHLITADFPGAFRAIFEKYFPGAIAIFLQGAGGDARPSQVAKGDTWQTMPHNQLPLIGEVLFQEVLRVLINPMELLTNLDISADSRQVFIPVVDNHIDRKTIERKLPEASGFYRIYLEELLKLIRLNKKPPEGLAITVQMLRFNKYFCILGVQGEVTAGLGKKIEDNLSTIHNMVLGYTPGSICYLLDREEYVKGGYEVSSYIYHLLPSPLSPDMENIILNTVRKLDNHLIKA